MRIENDLKLDFSDVLFRPKRSTLTSRKEVSLERRYIFKHSQHTYEGIPIMAANMDGVGSLEMALALQKHQLFTTLVKSYHIEDFEGLNTQLDFRHFAISTGTSQYDLDRIDEILKKYKAIKFICIDVANGYSEVFGDFVEKVRKK